jgi:hypothetical protein
MRLVQGEKLLGGGEVEKTHSVGCKIEAMTRHDEGRDYMIPGRYVGRVTIYKPLDRRKATLVGNTRSSCRISASRTYTIRRKTVEITKTMTGYVHKEINR